MAASPEKQYLAGEVRSTAKRPSLPSRLPLRRALCIASGRFLIGGTVDMLMELGGPHGLGRREMLVAKNVEWGIHSGRHGVC